MTRAARGKWTAVALVAGVLATGCSGGGDDGDGDGSGGRSGDPSAVLRSVTDLSGLTGALVDERNSSSLRILGLDDAVVESLTLEEARQATDQRLGEVRPGPVSTASEGLADEVAALRGDVDERIAAGAGSMADVPDAQATTTAYREVIDRLGDDAEAAVLASVDDPRLQAGLELQFGAERLGRLAGDLSMQLVTASLDGGVDGSEEIGSLSEAWSEFEATVEEIRSTGVEPYSDVVAANFPTAPHDAFAAIVTTALESGTADLPATLTTSADAAEAYTELSFALRDALVTVD